MEKSVDSKITEEKQPDTSSPADDLTLKGRFDRYNSAFLQLMIPLLTTRYVWLALEDINPFNFLKKPDPKTLPGFTEWKKPELKGYLSRNFAALGMGATTLGVMAFYSKRTYEDIRTLYAEAVGYELGKKTEDVNWGDIFLKSHNAALEVTRDAFVKRTLTRFAAGAAFLLPWHAFRGWKTAKPKFDANVNAGVGAVGTYLSIDGFVRSPTFFEAEQNLVDKTINHLNTNTHEIIGSKQIESLLMLQRKHLDKEYKWPKFNSPESQNEEMLATHIANSLNDTYNNTGREPVNFTIGKFNYLVGFGLLDTFPASLAFVELASRSPDMQSVTKAAAAIKTGQDTQQVFQEFGIDISNLTSQDATPVVIHEPAVTKFTDSLRSVKEKPPLAARTHQDFAAQVTAPPPFYLD